jgi:hypothetical protein
MGRKYVIYIYRHTHTHTKQTLKEISTVILRFCTLLAKSFSFGVKLDVMPRVMPRAWDIIVHCREFIEK